MSYNAIIAAITFVAAIPGADNIVAATVCGETVIVGKNNKVGDIGVFFATDGQLSSQFLKANNLFKHSELNANITKKGYFEDNGRVRAQLFKKVKSNGFFCELEYLKFTGYGISQLKLGNEFNELNGVPICQKYKTPATIRALQNKAYSGNAPKQLKTFPKHKETGKLLQALDFIPDGSILYITEKLHGTSARIGNVYDDWYERRHKWNWLNSLLIKFDKIKRAIQGYDFYNINIGSRNVTYRNGIPGGSFYGSEQFRFDVVKGFLDNLHKDEVIYGEIVGYTHTGAPIMTPQDTSSLKDIAKKYGEKMIYSYGCVQGQCKFFVYRITRVNRDGKEVDLSWPQVKARCKELGIPFVPELICHIYSNSQHCEVGLDKESIKTEVEHLAKDNSTLDETHIKEGVCVRVEPHEGNPFILKYKSWEFGVLEGYLKADDNFVDTEESS